jgi:hypothetical protein
MNKSDVIGKNKNDVIAARPRQDVNIIDFAYLVHRPLEASYFAIFFEKGERTFKVNEIHKGIGGHNMSIPAHFRLDAL